MQTVATIKYRKENLEQYLCREKTVLDNKINTDISVCLRGFKARGLSYSAIANIFDIDRHTVADWANGLYYPRDRKVSIILIASYNNLLRQEEEKLRSQINDNQ